MLFREVSIVCFCTFAKNIYNMADINTFLEFAESLKLVRRANLEKEGKTIIEKIYTDLLPNNGVINKVNLPRTTIVVGRKGTGKSTIFINLKWI